MFTHEHRLHLGLSSAKPLASSSSSSTLSHDYVWTKEMVCCSGESCGIPCSYLFFPSSYVFSIRSHHQTLHTSQYIANTCKPIEYDADAYHIHMTRLFRIVLLLHWYLLLICMRPSWRNICVWAFSSSSWFKYCDGAYNRSSPAIEGLHQGWRTVYINID